ncbi:MAG: hypothetical protein ABJA10_04850, partial [Aestuariivirga sp.]
AADEIVWICFTKKNRALQAAMSGMMFCQMQNYECEKMGGADQPRAGGSSLPANEWIRPEDAAPL